MTRNQELVAELRVMLLELYTVGNDSVSRKISAVEGRLRDLGGSVSNKPETEQEFDVVLFDIEQKIAAWRGSEHAQCLHRWKEESKDLTAKLQALDE